MYRTFTRFTLLVAAVLGTAFATAQQGGEAAVRFLQKHHPQLDLSISDVAQLEVTDSYASPSGTEHVYVRQLHLGVPVFNAQAILHLRGDNPVHQTIDLVADLENKINTATAALTPEQAAQAAAQHIGTATFAAPIATGRDGREHLLNWSEVATGPVRVSSVYYPLEGQSAVRLAYQVLIDQRNSPDNWVLVIDAEDGSLLQQLNQTLYCSFGAAPAHRHNYATGCAGAAPGLSVDQRLAAAAVTGSTALVADGARYNVFPFGLEAPLFGERQMEVDPADPTYSPFGWHDTNGEEGAEYTFTRGNNTHAYLDLDNSNTPSGSAVTADGGDSLVFDFYYETGASVDTLQRAALTQLFYTTNMVHDWMAAHGFDEASGNFQAENYTGEGRGNDPVQAEAQDGGGLNNANFSTPQDGSRPRMQMYVWENGAASVMRVEEPFSLAGPRETGTAQFGELIGATPLTAQVAIARDGSADPLLVCENVANGGDISGKIALINRGECFFEQKVDNAESAGAVGVVICNPENLILNMAEATDASQFDVQIPSVLIRESDCAPLRAAIEAGDTVVMTFQSLAPPPVDGDFDSGIVAHEIGHGVSNRLVGGPGNSSCLGTVEQMGEGWSDFLTLASTPKTLTATPDGSEPRGIGNYATAQATTGRGIRRLPYSTDMSINDHTYDAIITSGTPHPLGEVWATTLWDMYWVMVENYGFDDDLINGTGGNNIAVRLVVEGLKYTKCNPGVLDGRDGILAADAIEFDGEYNCLIWEAFARRGMGFSARQGSANSQADNIESYDGNPACTKTVKFTKTSDVDLIQPGDGVTFSYEIRNDRDETATNIIITDVVPDGMTIDAGSVRGTDVFSIDGNRITMTVDELDPEDDTTLRFTVGTDGDLTSTVNYEDGAEELDDAVEILALEGDAFWDFTEEQPFAGDYAFFVANVETDQDQVLQTLDPIEVSGDKPALRFFTKYDTESGWDGGYVQVSFDAENWIDIDDKMIRNGYRGEVAQSAFDESGVQAFWGDSDIWFDDRTVNGYVEIIADMSAYRGEEIFVRFRFGSDGADAATGWWVDNIQMVDLFSYDSEATLISDAGDAETASLGNAGVVVFGGTVNVVDPELGYSTVTVFPNPADEVANVRINTERSGSASVELYGMDGRRLQTQQLDLRAGRNQTALSTADLPAGVYVVRVFGATQISTTKLTIK